MRIIKYDLTNFRHDFIFFLNIDGFQLLICKLRESNINFLGELSQHDFKVFLDKVKLIKLMMIRFVLKCR